MWNCLSVLGSTSFHNLSFLRKFNVVMNCLKYRGSGSTGLWKQGSCLVNLIKVECQVGSFKSQDPQNISTFMPKKVQIEYLHASKMLEVCQISASVDVHGKLLTHAASREAIL